MVMHPHFVQAELHDGQITLYVRHRITQEAMTIMARLYAADARQLARDLLSLADSIDPPRNFIMPDKPPESGFYWTWSRELKCWLIGAWSYRTAKKVWGDASLFDLKNSFPVHKCGSKSPFLWGPKIEVPAYKPTVLSDA